ncbi:MAG: phenylalanine--tRNA ligase subunit alpha [Deltaproteobacteria bacterium]
MPSLADRLESGTAKALERISEAADERALDDARVAALGKKGELTAILRELSSLSPEERPAAGEAANRAKTRIEQALSGRREALSGQQRQVELSRRPDDVTLPSFGQPSGHPHPLSSAMDEACDLLRSFGFSVVEGPEVEDDHHNFEALNIPADHPARDMQDTFFVEGGGLLRTHTSPVQIRVMEERQPPLMVIAPGAVYRIDDDATHSPMFHQIEGLMVDRELSFAHLKAVLSGFLHAFFGDSVAVRFRPSYFPFTEPSAETDIGCVICGGGGTECRVCKGTGWLEILGCGMVHPAVFQQVGYDPEIYSGFAFGVGVERLAMLKYGIDDIRLFYGGDLRFLEQF